MTAAYAQDTKLEVRSPDTVKTVLDRLVGKRVSLVLTTGPELAGVVSVVGDKVVMLTDLTNREFFDGVISMEHIAAVIVRTRTAVRVAGTATRGPAPGTLAPARPISGRSRICFVAGPSAGRSTYRKNPMRKRPGPSVLGSG